MNSKILKRIETSFIKCFKTLNTIFILYLGIMFLSCDVKHGNESQIKSLKTNYCGNQLSTDEFNSMGSETTGNYNPYLIENSSEVFLEMYDSVKQQIDRSKVYELSLVKLKPKEVWLDLKVPMNCDYIEEITCIVMNSKFSSTVPRQVKIRIFEWSESFKKKETKILFGIKKLK